MSGQLLSPGVWWKGLAFNGQGKNYATKNEFPKDAIPLMGSKNSKAGTKHSEIIVMSSECFRAFNDEITWRIKFAFWRTSSLYKSCIVQAWLATMACKLATVADSKIHQYIHFRSQQAEWSQVYSWRLSVSVDSVSRLLYTQWSQQTWRMVCQRLTKDPCSVAPATGAIAKPSLKVVGVHLSSQGSWRITRYKSERSMTAMCTSWGGFICFCFRITYMIIDAPEDMYM